MRDGYVPPELEALRRRADIAFDPFRTRLIRARELPVPDIAPPDPEALGAAARRPDAPEELKAVDRAVRDGRTTWADVAAGRADQLPEVLAMHRAGAEQLARAQHEEPEPDAPPAAPPPRRPVRQEPVDRWDDEPPETFMRHGW